MGMYKNLHPPFLLVFSTNNTILKFPDSAISVLVIQFCHVEHNPTVDFHFNFYDSCKFHY